MLTLEEFVQLTQQAGNEDEEIRIDGDQPPEVAFRQLKAALNDKYGEAVGKGAFTDAGLEGKQERGEPLKVRDVNKALTRAEIRAAWPTVHFYIPFTAQELHKTRENKDEKWNGKVDYRSGKGLPDLLDSVLEYKEVIENEEKRKNVNVILVDDGSQALKNLTPRDTLYIMGHGVITDKGPVDHVTSSLEEIPKGSGKWTPYADGHTKVTAAEVVNRLKLDGVSNDVGKVKVFCCFSHDGEENSFGEQFRQAQEAAGLFPGAKVSSYKGPLKLVDTVGDDVRYHKSARKMDSYNDVEVGKVRASMAAYLRAEGGGYVPRPPKVPHVGGV